MSDERLGAEGTAPASPSDSADPSPVDDFDLDVVPEPAPAPPRRSAVRVVALVVVVAVVAAALGVLAGRRVGQASPQDEVQVAGYWRWSSTGTGESSVELSGELLVFSNGPDPVEVVGIDVPGGQVLDSGGTPTTLEPDTSVGLPATVEAPCDGEPPVVVVDVRVVGDRATGEVQRLELGSLDDPLLGTVAQLCETAGTPVAVLSALLQPDGAVEVGLLSSSDGPVEVFVYLAEGSGAQVDGTNGASTLVDAGATATLRLAPVVVDCAAAQTFLSTGEPVATTRVRTADGLTSERLEGWRDRALGSALGSAYSRDCS